jgi:hypothetical protein
MYGKTLKDLANEDLIRELVVSNQFLKDEELTRYEPDRLKDYIRFCCKQKSYIEAYSLTLQYVDALFWRF